MRLSLKDKGTPIPQLKQYARNLDTLIMQPVRQLLGESKTILLSPDGALNLIPFEALVDENNRYLVETYSFTYLTAGRDLLRLQTQSPSRQPPVIFADPIFNRPGEGESVAVNPERDRAFEPSQSVYVRLEGTAVEGEEIASLLPEARLLTGSMATERAVKQLNSPSILHIATHGFFLSAPDPESVKETASEIPLLRSGLVLAGAKLRDSDGEDGILTAREATGLNLVGTKLVVLSACNTARGALNTGEGVYGLRRAFVIAGAQSQLMSLWKVEDFATKDLMIDYYQRLIANQSRLIAWRQLQLALLQGEDYQHPFYWASFIFSGDWTELNIDQ